MSTEEEHENMRRCTCCTGNFDIELEGGAEGFIGILPVVFCPTCKSGIMDFADQTAGEAFIAGYKLGFKRITPDQVLGSAITDKELDEAWDNYEEERWG